MEFTVFDRFLGKMVISCGGLPCKMSGQRFQYVDVVLNLWRLTIVGLYLNQLAHACLQVSFKTPKQY